MVFGQGFSQNRALRGMIKLQNSGSQPLADVSVSAFGANTVYSNPRGMFELIFAQKGPGASVSLIIEKEGFELINEREVENCVLRANPDDILFVVMAKRGERDKQALRYYDIIISNTQANFRRELQGIQSKLNNLAEDDAERKNLREEIRILQEEKESLLRRAEELAKQLATLDLDRASDLAKKSYEKFEAGDIKGAITILDERILKEILDETIEERERLDKQLLQVDSALDQGIRNFIVKARFHGLAREFDEALRTYEIAVQADTTNEQNILEVARFCAGLNWQKRAIDYYLKGLSLNLPPLTKAGVLASLGTQYMFDNKVGLAEDYLFEAEALISDLDQFDTHTKEKREVRARTRLILGDLYIATNEFEKAESAYLEASTILDSLSLSDQATYMPRRAALKSSMGVMFAKMNNFEGAKQKYEEAIDIFSQISKPDNNKYDGAMVRASYNLGIMYEKLNDAPNAERVLLKTISQYRQLVNANPEKYQYELAGTLSALGVLYKNQNIYDKAKPAYFEALSIQEELILSNPDRFEPELGRTLMNIGTMHKNLNEPILAEKALLRSLEIYERLALINSSSYDISASQVRVNLGNLYLNLKQYDKALECYLKSLPTFIQLYEKSPNGFGHHLSLIRNNLGNAYTDVQNYNDAELNFQEALSIRRQLAEKNPNRFDPYVASTLRSMGLLYVDMNAYSKADITLKESEEIYRSLIIRAPERFELALCTTLLNLATLRHKQLEKQVSSEWLGEGRAIVQELTQRLGKYNQETEIVQTMLPKLDRLKNIFDSFDE